jgi:hypothetical protein
VSELKEFVPPVEQLVERVLFFGTSFDSQACACMFCLNLTKIILRDNFDTLGALIK